MKSNASVTTVAIDLAKEVFQLALAKLDWLHAQGNLQRFHTHARAHEQNGVTSMFASS